MAIDPSKGATNMQGVDTILAMPQWYVNFNLANLLATGKTTDGKSLQDVSLTLGGNDWLQGKVASLSTVLHVDGSTKKVKFVVSFESGTIDYYDLTQHPPVQEQADISGLSFGFLVDLSFEDLANNEDLPPDVRAQVEARMSNLGAGAFTIQQFFMDLTEAAVSIPDPTVTQFPTGFPASAKAAFPRYMATYVEGVRQAGGHVLGYGVKVQNPGGISDPDTLLYLMMTGSDPTFPSNLKPWWGNFVVPGDDTAGIDGCTSIRTKLFVTEFLLPRLAPIVCTYWTLQDTNGSLDIKSAPAVGQFTPMPLGGTWSSGQISSKAHKTNSASNDDASYNSCFDVTLQVTPGDHRIVIQRRMKFDVQVTHWYGLDGKAAKDRIHVWYEIPSTITITLDGIDDGALQVSVDVATKQPDPNVVYSDSYGWLITKCEGSESVWKKVGDVQEKCIEAAVAVAVPEGLGTQLKQQIERSMNLTPFVFPAGSQLFMKDPAFNRDGDLLAGVQYKG